MPQLLHRGAQAPPCLTRRLPAQTQTWGGTRQRTVGASTRANTRASDSSAVASAVAQQSALGGSRSLSTLLQKRASVRLTPLLCSNSAARRAPQRSDAPPYPHCQAEESDLPDIDAADKENPLAACEVRSGRQHGCLRCVHANSLALRSHAPLPTSPKQYVNSIYSYYYRVEGATAVGPTYMSSQTDINDKMRAILVDWLVEVHLKFKLMPETLFLTVNLIDRYLALAPVTRKNLQLVGVTAMLLASKYEEIWAPEVRCNTVCAVRMYGCMR